MAMMKRQREEFDRSINLANVLMLLSRGSGRTDGDGTMGRGRVFECKTCNRQFSSFQALGGHRASHKRPKIVLSGRDDNDQRQTTVAKPKVHECSICGLEFAVGQALGGHMRRHRVVVPAGEGFAGRGLVVEKKSSSSGKRVLLDLNLPPLELELDSESEEEDKRFMGLRLGLGLGLGDHCR